MLYPRYVDAGNHTIAHRLESRTLYTDGSYDHGVAGWAVVEGEECIYQDWSRGCTSNMAEGEAIRAALQALEGGPGVILTDSLAWCKAIANRRLKGKESKRILQDCLDLMHDRITLNWIPGHTGMIRGNELADSYARQARVCKLSSRDRLRMESDNTKENVRDRRSP